MKPLKIDLSSPPRTLSPAEAAAYLGISLPSWYRHVHPHVVAGSIQSLAIGSMRRIITASLDTWIAEQGSNGYESQTSPTAG